jgi:hypothetical protein
MNENWDICDYSGSKLWEVPLDITLIEDCKHKVIVAKPIPNKEVILYQCDGTEVDKLTISQWKKLQAKFVNTYSSPINYAEIDYEFSY